MSPFYVYACSKCRHQFDIRQRYDSPLSMRCPNCEGVAQRKITPINHTFGWRLTRKEEYEKLGKDDLVRNV